MSFEIALTFLVLVLAFTALAFDLWSPDAILLTAVAIVTAGGVISIEQAVQQFGNTTLVALGSLYVIAAALRNSGILDRASELILGSGNVGIRRVLLRMCPGVTVYSAFLNNTPIVAMGIPALRRWARNHNVSVSKLLIPLSYAAILGGICTLIGTSTNLIAHGLLQENGIEGFSFFELAWLGVPCALVGLLYIVFVSPELTPVRRDIRDEEEEKRESLLELQIMEDSPQTGVAVSQSGLVTLPGFRLVRINREGVEIAPIGDQEVLREGDRLFYEPLEDEAGALPDLNEYPGLRLVVPPPRPIEKNQKRDRELHQVVIKEGSRLVGDTLEEAKFLERFGVAVTGVRRGEKRLHYQGDIRLQPGDVLLLDTKRGFQEAHEGSHDFYLTSEAGGDEPHKDQEAEVENKKNMYASVLVLAGVVASVTAGIFHIALAGILGVAALIALDVIEPGEARESVDWTVLIVIGAALALGKAMEISGAADIIGNGIIQVTHDFGPRTTLAALVLVTAVFTETITNNGAVALLFPVALSMAESQGFEPRAYIISITLVSSMALLTPIGYQTNLMVYGPGNYKFTDFFKVGFPLALILWALVILLAPFMWPV